MMIIDTTYVNLADVDAMIARQLGAVARFLVPAGHDDFAEEIARDIPATWQSHFFNLVSGLGWTPPNMLTSSGNANVFDKVPGEKLIPHTLYFYYFMLDDHNRLHQQVYFWPEGDPEDSSSWAEISPDRAKEIATELTKNARKPFAEQNPQPLALSSMDACTYEYISYLVFVMDEESWTFTQSEVTGSAAVVPQSGSGSEPNHSFYDAELFTVTPAPGEDRSAVSMINYMKDADGNYLGAVSEPAKFWFFFQVETEFGGTLGVWVDPGGTNEGPPRSPPP